VRALAAELLGRLGAIEAADRLIEAVGSDPAPAVRGAAARALGRAGVPRAANPLERALAGDPAAEVRRAAAWALGELGGGHGLDGLAGALRSGDHALARQAAQALVACGSAGRTLLERAAAGIKNGGAPAAGAGEARETLALLPAGAAG
jgi:HEAT repeat protein